MNRETYPASLFPLRGDLSAEAGAQSAKVVGIQGTPVSATPPVDQQLLRFINSNGDWEPSNDANTAITVNGVPTSCDYLVYVNGTFILVNGV